MVNYYPKLANSIRSTLLHTAETTTQKLDLSIVRDKSPRVNHLGISSVGKDCERCIWLAYHGYQRDRIEGRVQLLFEFGDYVEESIVFYLQLSGYTITRRQFESFICGGLVPGHCDGVLTIDLSEIVFDVKSANKAAFNAVKRHGTHKHYPSYYSQINSYAVGMGINYGMMIYQCKDDSDLFIEVFQTDKEHVKRLEDKTYRIISQSSPPKCTGDFIGKKFCGFKSSMYQLDQENNTCGGCRYFAVNKNCACFHPKHTSTLFPYGVGNKKFWCQDFEKRKLEWNR